MPGTSERPRSYPDLVALVGEENRCPGGKQTVREIVQRACLRPEDLVLEVGCTTGFTSLEIAALARCHTIGLDLSEVAVRVASARAAALAPYLDHRPMFLVGDVLSPPFAPGTFDLAICGGALAFTADLARALARVSDLVRPLGLLSVTMLAYRTPPPERLRRELAAVLGFEPPNCTSKMWLERYTSGGLELFDSWRGDLARRPSQVIDRAVEEQLSSVRDLSEADRRSWTRAMQVFNENHDHLEFVSMLLRKRPDCWPEQPEIFLETDRFDPFYEHDFVTRHA